MSRGGVANWSLTWPVPFRDHQGGRDSVEQAHCTRGVVKRYRDSHELASGIIFYWPLPTKKKITNNNCQHLGIKIDTVFRDQTIFW